MILTPEQTRLDAVVSSADEAIQEALSKGGTWGPGEAVEIMALLVSKYACGVATHLEGDRDKGENLKLAIDFVDMVSAVAKKGCEKVLGDTVH